MFATCRNYENMSNKSGKTYVLQRGLDMEGPSPRKDPKEDQTKKNRKKNFRRKKIHELIGSRDAFFPIHNRCSAELEHSSSEAPFIFV